jgi:hypothetical protein
MLFFGLKGTVVASCERIDQGKTIRRSSLISYRNRPIDRARKIAALFRLAQMKQYSDRWRQTRWYGEVDD